MVSQGVSGGNSRVAAKRMKAKICLVGEQAVGKTSLIRRYVLDEFSDDYIATMGAKVTKKNVEIKHDSLGNVQVNLVIWDIMGDKGFRDLLREAYFQGAQGIMAVCDVTRKETLTDLRSWIEAVSRVSGRIPTQVLANKIDLTHEMQFSETDVKGISGFYESRYLLTSAKTGENVENAFIEMARAVVDKRVTPSSVWEKQFPAMTSQQPLKVARKV
ncbi:MAG: GTP-binding protein [Methanomassiliicoccales archaeon]|nr:MAG: GTP-binding protein [Methanomassiliicoccales archaeon]